MKFRYLVFEHEDYYPAGGMDDCILKTNESIYVKRDLRNKSGCYVFDCLTGEVYHTVEEFEQSTGE